MKLKKISALLLAAALVFTAAPQIAVPALAEETTEATTGTAIEVTKSFDAYKIDGTNASKKVASYKNKLAERVFTKAFADKAKKGVYPGLEDTDALYLVFTLKRSGYKNDSFYKKVAAKITSQTKSIKKKGSATGNFSGKKVTFSLKTYATPSSWGSVETEKHLAKIVLCATSLGLKADNLGGLNLIKKMAKKSNFEASANYPTSREMMMLLAFNSGDYKLPAGKDYVTRKDLIEALTGEALDQNIENSYGYVDAPVMMISPLMPYYAKDAKVAAAYKKVDDFVATEGKKTDEASNFVNNAYSLAQVMITMGEDRLATFGGFDRDQIIAYANKAAKEELNNASFTSLSLQLLQGYTTMSYAVSGKSTTLYRDLANPVKSVKADAKSLTLKKGKKAKVTFTVSSADNRAAFGPVSYNKKAISKIAKVTTKATNTKVVVTLKATKKGSAKLVLSVGSKKAKVKVTVK